MNRKTGSLHKLLLVMFAWASVAASAQSVKVPDPALHVPDDDHLLVFKGESVENARERSVYPESEDDQKMSIKVPDGDAPLGNPVQLTLNLAPGRISAPPIYVQSDHKDQAFDGGLAKVVKESGQAITIETTPLKLGPVNVLVQLVYLDNTLVRQTARLNVVPSAVGLKRFKLNQGFPIMPLILEGVGGSRQGWFQPEVSYEGVKFPIYLEDSSQIKLTVEQDKLNPVISLDKAGLVKAIREGTAIVTGEFAGMTDKIKVQVTTKETASSGGLKPLRSSRRHDGADCNSQIGN